MKVVFAARANAALKEIGDYIAQDRPRRAASFVAELRTRARQLGDMPRAFPMVPRYAQLGIRRRPYRRYLISYRIEAERILILLIVHGARDYHALLTAEQ